jgi:aconitate hydratase
LRVVLETVLRNCDGKAITEGDVRALANWNAKKPAEEEIPFVVARIVLQDFTGVPLLVDLAAMRGAVRRLGKEPGLIEPLVPVDLVVDHSVQVDFSGSSVAFERNLELEFQRNQERYEFLKWGQQAFKTFKVVPPGIGIVHQVNLEYLAQGVLRAEGSSLVYPDTLVGTDSHTTMINGLGIVGWGVGGIEAEAGMLGQPVYFLTPEVVGVHMTGHLREGVTATDLALHVTEMLRKFKVVGKFVEFYGPGAASLPLPDRATIANMAPEYGATMGYFPVDDESVCYLEATGRTAAQVELFREYFRAQGLYGMPTRADGIAYTADLDLDLGDVQPSVAGPKRPQDRIQLAALKERFVSLLTKAVSEGGYGLTEKQLAATGEVVPVSPDEQAIDKELTRTLPQAISPEAAAAMDVNVQTAGEMTTDRPTPDPSLSMDSGADCSTLRHGSVLIAAITSCTNTSNPSVMLAAGLLAKKACQRGLLPPRYVKTSLAPGSRVVTDYLRRCGLQPYLDRLGFQTVGYGCTTCIGNSGPLDPDIEAAVIRCDLVTASVLSGNRNFEARVHQSIKANFLMSPPLVVAFALAGRVNIDMTREPLGRGSDGKDVYLSDVWPGLQEIRSEMERGLKPEVFRELYSDFAHQNPAWNDIPSSLGDVYEWDRESTYIQEPPFFDGFRLDPGSISPIHQARPLGIFGDSVTTDHISPAGSIKKSSPAGQFLIEQGVQVVQFNSYGSRRGNDRVMTRGTFANVRIKNLMVPGVEGGVTKHQPTGEEMSIYEAAMRYKEAKVPLIVLAGHEYGTGSSRDWAAKGTRLLGVRVVVAQSFERIHRSNLVGMGVLPCCFPEGASAATLGLDGSEIYSLPGLNDDVRPRQMLALEITRTNGDKLSVPVTVRIDTPIEVDYYRHGGILPYVLRQIIKRPAGDPVR